MEKMKVAVIGCGTIANHAHIPGYLHCGDVDGDGFITANDYNMARNAVLGKITLTPAQLKRGDVNQNGKIDARDYLLIRRMFLGTY